jgi:hypothetical protein
MRSFFAVGCRCSLTLWLGRVRQSGVHFGGVALAGRFGWLCTWRVGILSFRAESGADMSAFTNTVPIHSVQPTRANARVADFYRWAME